MHYRRIARWGIDVTDARLLHYLPTTALRFAAAMLDAMAMALLVPLADALATGAVSSTYGERLGLTALLNGLSVHQAFIGLLGGVFTLLILRSVLDYGAGVLSYRRDTGYSAKMQSALLARYLSFGQSFFDAESRGHVQRMMTFGETLLKLTGLAERVTANVLHSCSLFAVLLTISVRMTLVLVATMPIVYVLTAQLVKSILRWASKKRDRGLEIERRIYNTFAIVPLLKAYGRESEVIEEHRALLDEHRAINVRGTRLAISVMPIQQAVQLIALFGLALVAVAESADGGTTELVRFCAFLIVARRIMPTLEALADVRTKWAEARPDLEKIDEALVDDDKGFVPQGTESMPPLERSISIRKLTFTYGSEQPALDAIDLDILAGKTTALVGSTGSGKSSLAHLLVRLYDCPPNTIFVDDQDIRTFTHLSVRSRVTLVPQEPLLFHGTLRDNVVIGLNAPMSDDAIRSAFTDVALEELLARLPDGLNTEIGDRGASLSGGEKQRVALARALLRKPEILILDEATSALDTVTEAAVQTHLHRTKHTRTTLVIAHRLSTVRSADHIAVLDAGRIVQQGPHDALIAQRGEYQSMWVAQGGAETDR